MLRRGQKPEFQPDRPSGTQLVPAASLTPVSVLTQLVVSSKLYGLQNRVLPGLYFCSYRALDGIDIPNIEVDMFSAASRLDFV